jgi:hypothetical protein
MNKHQNRYWNTNDLYIAAFLFGKGATIVGIEANDSKATFSFLDSFHRYNWHYEFTSGKPLIDARVYALAIQALKHKAMDALIENNGAH